MTSIPDYAILLLVTTGKWLEIDMFVVYIILGIDSLIPETIDTCSLIPGGILINAEL